MKVPNEIVNKRTRDFEMKTTNGIVMKENKTLGWKPRMKSRKKMRLQDENPEQNHNVRKQEFGIKKKPSKQTHKERKQGFKMKIPNEIMKDNDTSRWKR